MRTLVELLPNDPVIIYTKTEEFMGKIRGVDTQEKALILETRDGNIETFTFNEVEGVYPLEMPYTFAMINSGNIAKSQFGGGWGEGNFAADINNNFHPPKPPPCRQPTRGGGGTYHVVAGCCCGCSGGMSYD